MTIVVDWDVKQQNKHCKPNKFVLADGQVVRIIELQLSNSPNLNLFHSKREVYFDSRMRIYKLFICNFWSKLNIYLAGTQQNTQMTSTTSEDSDWPVRPPSLISLRVATSVGSEY